MGNWAGLISCLQIQGPIWPETQYSICLFRMLWENYSRRAKVVSLEEQPGRLSWATVNNILLVGWIVTRTSDIESRQKVHSVRFSSTRDTCLAVFCTLSALTFISPTNLVDGPWLWVPILLSHRYSSRHRGANTTGETPVLSKWLDGGTSADECKETLPHFFFFFFSPDPAQRPAHLQNCVVGATEQGC